MRKGMLILCGLFLLGLNASAKESIRGHYNEVGTMPAAHSLQKVVFEEFMNFGCPHCNNLHKASKKLREKYAGKVEFIDIPILFRGQDDSPVRLYYVARKLGKGDQVKNELFKTRFTHNVDVFDAGIVNYLARSLGMRKEYQQEKDKPWVNELLKEGERKAGIYGVSGTPTVVLQYALKMDIGPYKTVGEFVKKLPETIEDLMQ